MAKSAKRPATNDNVTDLLYQSLETELGGVEIYRTALECVQNDDLREEWQKYLGQTEEHVKVMRSVCEKAGLDPDQDTPGRQIVRHIGKSLVKAMQMALGSTPPASAELVAAECITLAETKDHMNWELMGKLAEASGSSQGQLGDTDVEDEEDEHLYHTAGWTRELWLKAIGLPAQLPPPEEVEGVHSMEEAAHAKKSARRPETESAN